MVNPISHLKAERKEQSGRLAAVQHVTFGHALLGAGGVKVGHRKAPPRLPGRQPESSHRPSTTCSAASRPSAAAAFNSMVIPRMARNSRRDVARWQLGSLRSELPAWTLDQARIERVDSAYPPGSLGGEAANEAPFRGVQALPASRSGFRPCLFARSFSD